MDIGGHLPEIIIVLVIILIIWGPGKLPDVGAAMGRGIREFRKASAETRDAVLKATAMPEEPAPNPAEAGSGAGGAGRHRTGAGCIPGTVRLRRGLSVVPAIKRAPATEPGRLRRLPRESGSRRCA